MNIFSKQTTLSINEKISRLKVVGFHVNNENSNRGSRCGHCREMHYDGIIVYVPDFTTYKTPWEIVDTQIHSPNGRSTGWCATCAFQLLPDDPAWYSQRLLIYERKQQARATRREKGLREEGPNWAGWYGGIDFSSVLDMTTQILTITRTVAGAETGYRYILPYVIEEWLAINEYSWEDVQTLPSFKSATVETFDTFPGVYGGVFNSSEDAERASKRYDAQRREWKRQQKLKNATPYDQHLAVCQGVFGKDWRLAGGDI